MKLRLIIIVCLVLVSSMVFAEEKKAEQKKVEQKQEVKALVLKTEKDKASYAIGMDMGKFIKNDKDVDPNIALKAIKDMIAGTKPLLSEDEAQAIMIKFQQDLVVKQQARAAALAEKNKKEGEAFLAKNKTKAGVTVLPSGLQYKIITEGTGKSPTEADSVVVNYRGTLIDGKEFDSSYKRKQPDTFAVNGVIKGWIEALQLMKEGSKWQLVVPADLAYGAEGSDTGSVGPNAVLIFEIELISVKAAE